MEENSITTGPPRLSVVLLTVQSRIDGTRSRAFVIAGALHEPVTGKP